MSEDPMPEPPLSEGSAAGESVADAPPDRLSVDPASKFYNEALLVRGVGIRFKGQERADVEEYCVSENWIRAPVGKTRDRKGQPLIIKMTGPVEPYFLTPPQKSES